MAIKEIEWDEIKSIADRPDTGYARFAETKSKRIWFAEKKKGEVVAVGSLLMLSMPRLSNLFVVSECRGKGLGKRMIEARVDWARAHGFGAVDARTVKRGLFEACGFVATKEWKSGGWSMEKKL